MTLNAHLNGTLVILHANQRSAFQHAIKYTFMHGYKLEFIPFLFTVVLLSAT